MRLHLLLLAFLLMFLMPVPGFARLAGRSCNEKGGICMAFRCSRGRRQIGGCRFPGIKCCSV
ncbi:unnamed protein product [Pipistrellus nathusii]|uniref:Beta-defensin-like domain-containing protein n=1 Tax=Pipistrellus nathusii TaxID=59473 RepID=A0ABN9ZWL4_PIPNA